MAAVTKKFTLVFYAPPAAVAACKSAIFSAGAGRYPGPGGYTEACWAASGNGQFRPGMTATPHIGEKGKLEELEEVRVEAFCNGEDVMRGSVEALKK